MKKLQLKDLVFYFKSNSRKILLSALVGLIIGLSYCIYTPKLYESSFTLMLGRIDLVGQHEIKHDRLGQEIPFILDAQRGFSSPDFASDEILTLCDYSISNKSRKYFLKSIEVIRSPDNQQLLVRIRMPGKDRSFKCAKAMAAISLEAYRARLRQVLTEIKLQKRELMESDFIIRQPGLNGMLLVSDEPVLPNCLRTIIGVMLACIAGVLYLSWVWKSASRKLNGD